MTYRVVLVDDVPEIRQILRLILEHAGPFVVVGEGRSGTEAVALATDLRPDLLVMDVEMRGGPSGWEVLPQIRDATPETAIVILSGSAAVPLRMEGDAMADAVLEKGMPPQEFNAALLAILGEPAVVKPPTAARTPALANVVPADPAAVLAALVDITSDAVVELTLTGEVRTWNAGAERLFRVSPEEAVGRSFASLAGGEGASSELDALIARAAAGERIDAPGYLRQGTLTLVPLPAGVLAVGRDRAVTQASGESMAWAVAELAAKNRELDRAGRELEGFASVASHDLAQPLQVAYGYLEMVRSEFSEGMDETALSWIDAAVGSLERMRLLVQDILAFARTGNRDVELDAVSVEEAAQSAIAALETFVLERQADVRLRRPLPVVHAHDGHLAQVLERLLDNAVRFVPEGTKPIVEVFADEGATEWVITVADNGPGISAELTERVFDLFYRGARTSNSGTGLGLSICRKLIGRLGGRIWVEGRPADAQGAWIRFALPKGLT